MAPQKEPPKPPKNLSKAAETLWKQVVSDFELELHHLNLLAEACQQLGRAEAARKLIEVEGITVADRFRQVKPHPAVDIERQAATTFQRLMRELGLDIEPPAAPRGPRRPGTRD